MTRRWWQGLIALLWAVLPAVRFQYSQAWDSLPARMTTHFGFNGQPNGWMSREGAMWFMLLLVLFMLITATVVLLRVRKPDGTAYALLGMFYVVMIVIYRVSGGLIAYNVSQQPLNLVPDLAAMMFAVFAVIIVALISNRGTTLPEAGVIAEETHSSPLWTLFFAAMLLGEICLAVLIPIPFARLILIPVCILFVGITAMAGSGFHYKFRRSGIEISTLGFRLRSIPSEKIREYAVQDWNPLYGYGIRGRGERRAYVWGNRGVRIKTSDGEVFLGHSNPDRIVHDLDVIKQFA
jgi:hypothetical protein